jgi:hypothetical protein
MTSAAEHAPAEKPKPKSRVQEQIETLFRDSHALRQENRTLVHQLEEAHALIAYLTERLRSKGLAMNALTVQPHGRGLRAS